jgi:hypothetical protein
MEVGDIIWNILMLETSSKSTRVLNLSQNSRKINLNELWSDWLIEIFIANLSKLHFGKVVLYCDLQGLYYDLRDMHILTP